MKKLLVIFAVLIMLLISCQHNCDSEMDDIKSELGNPEEITSWVNDDFHAVTYWYYSRGVKIVFMWSDDVDCRKQTFTFSPTTDLSEKSKEKILKSEKLISIEKSCSGITN